jgi:hypothetical protein
VPTDERNGRVPRVTDVRCTTIMAEPLKNYVGPDMPARITSMIEKWIALSPRGLPMDAPPPGKAACTGSRSC